MCFWLKIHVNVATQIFRVYRGSSLLHRLTVTKNTLLFVARFKMTSVAENCTLEGNEKPLIREGKAEILVPSSQNVFYNPVQEFNRDLSVAALTLLAKEHSSKLKSKNEDSAVPNDCGDDGSIEPGRYYKDGLVILEALSATGLRSIRYAKEVPGIKEIISNDISESAVKSIKENISFNKVDNLVVTSHNDAVMVMYMHRHFSKRVHAVDLDPYGCPTPFLDAAVQCVADGGLMLVTCTDMAVLAGNSPETCYVKYGSVSLRTKNCHEMALRIVLQCIESHANRYGRYIVPMISVSADFYVRVIVKIFTGPVVCKRTTSKVSLVYQCVGCESQVLQPLGIANKFGDKTTQYKYSLPHGPPVGPTCEHCNHKFHIGGPIWTAPIHDKEFVSGLCDLITEKEFGTHRRMEGVLAVIQEELLDVPLYYSLDKLCSTVKAEMMSLLQFRSALMNAGYDVSLSHAQKCSIKTDAPTQVVWDVIRTWVKMHPVKEERLTDTGKAILEKTITTQVCFDIHPNANPTSRQMGLVRFQENPCRYWGPGTRSKTGVKDEKKMEKSKRNQGKRSRSESAIPNVHAKCAKADNNSPHKEESKEGFETCDGTQT